MTKQPSQTNPNVGPAPVDAKPNHVREKTYVAPNPPEHYQDDVDALPEQTAERKVENDLPGAVDRIKKAL